MNLESHRSEVLRWRRERDESIREENSWLALAGLFWLKPGKNRAGSDPSCEIVLPARAPNTAGYFELTPYGVAWQSAPGTVINVRSGPREAELLQPDTAEQPSYIRLDDLQLVVIRRGERFGVRLWDNLRAERRTHPKRSWFDVDASFRCPAHLTAYAPGVNTILPDALGENSEVMLDGYVTFAFGGHRYQLDVTRESDGSCLVRFWDPTSQTETYPAGRYLDSTFDNDGGGVLDFNYARNPPCAFTPFATCLFAPQQHRLDFRVEAGERYPLGQATR
jgi:hypothetical protein